MTVVVVTLVVVAVAVAAAVAVLRRRGAAHGVDAAGDRQHEAARGYERAVHDARTVHGASAMGDQYHR
ncbi:hypothetical protein [Actinacidiphila bryophytorum]|uniref:hypothetical protein n=1 Tax=Actinacidiphila bryophytorum TaxID=1436133 RepID=UPI0019602230|nr:hypothetical protein [Actinacidiphila bryophytorum]MBM9439695.1 hypothetical protein [Actinacidiphila bryophytorum]MBN6545987.1 hypothetical protein [Actinacidiphila bryophytorum]